MKNNFTYFIIASSVFSLWLTAEGSFIAAILFFAVAVIFFIIQVKLQHLIFSRLLYPEFSKDRIDNLLYGQQEHQQLVQIITDLIHSRHPEINYNDFMVKFTSILIILKSVSDTNIDIRTGLQTNPEFTINKLFSKVNFDQFNLELSGDAGNSSNPGVSSVGKDVSSSKSVHNSHPYKPGYSRWECN